MSESEFGPLHPQPRNWDEVVAITGGLKDVPIEEIEHGRHDWEYHFSSSDMRACGRKGCEQLHANGWVIALAGRRYVNIGNCCFRKYARQELFNAGNRAHRDRRRSEARVAALVTVRDEAQRMLHWLDSAPEIARAISLHMSFLIAAKGPLLREIERRAEKMNVRIERDIKLSDEEMEARREMHRGARAENEPGPYVSRFEKRHVGDIVGLQTFRVGRDPKCLHRRLQSLTETLLTWSPSESDADANKSMVRAMRDFGPYTNDLKQGIRETEQFFSDANLKTLMMLDVIRSQGIVSISCRDGTVEILRLPHWTIRAA